MVLENFCNGTFALVKFTNYKPFGHVVPNFKVYYNIHLCAYNFASYVHTIDSRLNGKNKISSILFNITVILIISFTRIISRNSHSYQKKIFSLAVPQVPRIY